MSEPSAKVPAGEEIPNVTKDDKEAVAAEKDFVVPDDEDEAEESDEYEVDEEEDEEYVEEADEEVEGEEQNGTGNGSSGLTALLLGKHTIGEKAEGEDEDEEEDEDDEEYVDTQGPVPVVPTPGKKRSSDEVDGGAGDEESSAKKTKT